MSHQPASPPLLLMRRGPQPNHPFPLGKSVITIGRGPDNDIVVDDAEVSRHHARLARRGNDWTLEDLGSHNGTFVNSQRITGPVKLTPGAQVGLGSRVLFSLEMGLSAPPRRKGGFGWLTAATPLAILLILSVLALLGALAYLLYQRQQEQARAEFEPPTVLVTEPVPGVPVPPAGQYLTVSATAWGHIPIGRVELWLDGELKETQDSDQPEGLSPFYANFGPLMSEGPHMLFVRAVNTLGVVGQSLPVSVVSAPKPGPDEGFLAVPVGPGETLASIAGAYGTDVATLQKVNPDLNGQEPAAGTAIKVPVPPGKVAPAPNSPPPPVPGGSSVQVPNVPMLKVVEPTPRGVGFGPVVGFLVAGPPAQPDGLQAQVKDCKVTLSWNDNATNEVSYEVWMAGLGLPQRTIAKLEPSAPTGPAWFEFPAPQPGFFSFWVEAVNLLGRQPSNIAWVYVDPQCPTTLATHLQVEALDMSVGGSYDRAYCYASFEGAPEVRLPGDKSAFIQVKAGQGDIAAWAAGSHKFAVPIPADGAVEIGGECWGWSGKALNELGSFSGKFGTETWDGARRVLEGGSFQIGVAIKPLGALDTRGTYADRSPGLPGSAAGFYWLPEPGKIDPSLPVPYNLKMMGKVSPGVPGSAKTFLTWDWDGDKKAITGFMVFLNSAGYKEIPNPDARAVQVDLGTSCGDRISWQVVAIAGPARSNFSAPLEYDLPKCPLYAHVTFKTISLLHVRDRGVLDVRLDPCDNIGAWLGIYANDQKRIGGSWWADLYTGPKAAEMTCGSYTFKQLFQLWYNEPNPDVLVVPLYGENPELTFATRFQSTSENVGSFANWKKTISMPRDQWTKFNQDFSFFGYGYAVADTTVINVKGSDSPNPK
jgi:LysM repeat protein